MTPINFKVVRGPWNVRATKGPFAFLVRDNWNDWGYVTLFALVYFDANGAKHDIGHVKIGQFGMGEGHTSPAIPGSFEALGKEFFSLGQDDSYYEALHALGGGIRDMLLKCLRDVAADPAIWRKARKEEVTQKSLLREVSAVSVEGQYRRLAQGENRLSSYDFEYTAPSASGVPPMVLKFQVRPQSYPPTNIHVLIGRNGVGKTSLLQSMARAIVEVDAPKRRAGRFTSGTGSRRGAQFANLVSVSFSAFDPFIQPQAPDESTGTVRYTYVGLKGVQQQPDEGTKDLRALAVEFVESVRGCIKRSRVARWRRALAFLEADPIFKEAGVTGLASEDTIDNAGLREGAEALFRGLSSGHKIALLSTTKLVETVEERTLVLMDEPEAHLHPPLLSAFVRALSDLLIERNGVGILATHSPVVLQEVPKECVWKIRRNGAIAKVERPSIETFGENVGVLTREAFGLEVTHSGFHAMLAVEVDKGGDFKSVLASFGDCLGAEARAVAQAMISERDSGDEA